jgi:4-alpha-glucanotransferase
LNQDSIIHDSHQDFFRSPFGAVTCNTTVSLRVIIRTCELPESVTIRQWHAGCEKRIPMTLWRDDGEEKVYQAEIIAPAVAGLLWYYFIIKLQGLTYYYGNNTQGLGGKGQRWGHNPRGYQITVFRQEAATPHWFKEGLVYQIFVDRFYNGHEDGKINNPPKGSLIHPYWDDTPFYVRDTGTGRIFAYDFFGGNLQGVLKKLSYLKELGVSAIYLNPVFESPSNHKYDSGDYKQIDSMFGNKELFTHLCDQAREMGMHIILDGVFSHTGSNSRYFNKEGRYPELGAYQSPESPYYSWYRFKEYPERYESWWDIDTMPNVNELEPSYINFIIDNQDSVLRHWLNAGIKGWRLDVADELPDQFIKHFRTVMKEFDPDTVLIGEVWEDASNKVSYGTDREYFWGDGLDSVTNYPFRNILLDFMLGKNDAAETQRRLLSLYENYPRENFYAAMNVLGSHDVPRILTLLGEAPPHESLSIIDQANYRLPPEQRNLAVKRLKLLTLWQMTFPGAPCIYYGDEAGLEGFTDPFNRGTYPWGQEDRELLAWYYKITNLRGQYAALRTGDWLPLPVSDDVYGFVRKIDNGRDVFGQLRPSNVAIILLNRNKDCERLVSLDLAGYCQDTLTDILHDDKIIAIPEGKLEITLQALEGTLLVWRKEEKPAFERASGILLHPTSLPSPYGIGDFGPEAYAFIDFLAQSKQALWQILPLNPPGYGESPYQSVSAFAGSHMLISPHRLVEQGLLTAEDINTPPQFDSDKVVFPLVTAYKEQILQKAFRAFKKQPPDVAYRAFIEENRLWLKDYALFMALKSHFNGLPWNEWSAAAALRKEQELRHFERLLSSDIQYHYFLQYVFYDQWQSLKHYANSKGIKVVGDLPIFVSYDSSDVWANKHLFQLNQQGRPTIVAGVPPDYFSETGQLWGNPHYDWQMMEQDDYRWWRKRFSSILKQVDIIRIDHFRGFDAYWAVPANEETAVNGQWIAGPGHKFFATMEKYFGRLPVIAEDLGVITPPVENLRDKFNFPGMKVLQFAFESQSPEKFLPERYEQNLVVYTGTHDNDTTLGWLKDCLVTKPEILSCVQEYLSLGDGSTQAVCWQFIEFALATNANTVILPLQDILCLDTAARMNRPGTVGGNWDWRCRRDSLSVKLAEQLAQVTRNYAR